MDNFKCLYKKSLETYWRNHVHTYIHAFNLTDNIRVLHPYMNTFCIIIAIVKLIENIKVLVFLKCSCVFVKFLAYVLLVFFFFVFFLLSIIWKSDLTDKIKRSFFQAAVTSILIYGCTTWTLTKRLEKKLAGNYSRMLRAILNKSWRQHPTRHQLYGHLPPITKTIQVRRTRHAEHCWRSRDELIRDVLLWTPTHGRAKAGRPARTYIQQLCEDTGCCPEDLPRAMNDREEWRERESGISVLPARHDDDDDFARTNLCCIIVELIPEVLLSRNLGKSYSPTPSFITS